MHSLFYYYLLCSCVIALLFGFLQLLSHSFPLCSDNEVGSGGNKPEYWAIAQLHSWVQNLWFMCTSTDRPEGCSGCAEWSEWGRLSHVPRCLSSSCCDWGIWFISVYRAVKNPAAIQNPNGNDDSFPLYSMLFYCLWYSMVFSFFLFYADQLLFFMCMSFRQKKIPYLLQSNP